jgi:hypothetical protein
MKRNPRRIVLVAILGIGATVLSMGICVNSVRGDDDPPDFWVTYDNQVIVDPNAQQLYQSMGNILTGWAGLPNDRLNYYSAVDNNNDCVINGWQGIISNVEANCNGYLVTVAVVPLLASDTYGTTAVVMDSDYSEQFQVFKDSTFEYIQSLDPLGLAGQMPGLAGL